MSKHSNGSPVAYAAFSPNGNIRIWVTDQDEAKKIGDRIGQELLPLVVCDSEMGNKHLCASRNGKSEAQPAEPVKVPSDDEIMTKVQEFASTWATAGGRFDDGTAMARAEACKEEIRALLSGYDELREDLDALRTRINVLHRVIRSHERSAASQFREGGNRYDEGRRVAYDQCCAEIRDALAQKQESQS